MVKQLWKACHTHTEDISDSKVAGTSLTAKEGAITTQTPMMSPIAPVPPMLVSMATVDFQNHPNIVTQNQYKQPNIIHGLKTVSENQQQIKQSPAIKEWHFVGYCIVVVFFLFLN